MCKVDPGCFAAAAASTRCFFFLWSLYNNNLLSGWRCWNWLCCLDPCRSSFLRRRHCVCVCGTGETVPNSRGSRRRRQVQRARARYQVSKTLDVWVGFFFSSLGEKANMHGRGGQVGICFEERIRMPKLLKHHHHHHHQLRLHSDPGPAAPVRSKFKRPTDPSSRTANVRPSSPQTGAILPKATPIYSR